MAVKNNSKARINYMKTGINDMEPEKILTTKDKIIGIDIGGSHITACIVDRVTARCLDHSITRANIAPHGPAAEIIETWALAIESCIARVLADPHLQKGTRTKLHDPHHQPDAWRIGIAMPGPFDYEQGISLITGLHKYESLYGLNIKQLLAERLEIPTDNIRMVNDASAFLLGEVVGGAGKGYRRAAGITLGTGLGSAVYLDNIIHDGDLWCTPFSNSRAEDYLCSRWFVQEHEGKSITGVKDLVPLFHTDPAVRALFTTFGRNLAEILLIKYPPHTHDIIIIGGNITRAWDLFIPFTLEACREQGVAINIRPSLLGENAAIIGAAFLW